MATTPLGGFADLSSYRRLVDAQKAQNLGGLNNLIQSYLEGAQQGNVLVNLPEILQQQNQDRRNKALADQIALQMSGISLQEAQNPSLALDRALRNRLAMAATSPETGIIASPAGLQGETIGVPTALTPEQQALIPLREAAAIEAGVPFIPPTAAPLAPITPVTGVEGAPTGFAFSPEARRAEQELKLGDRIAAANARLVEQGIPGVYRADESGNLQFLPTRSFGGETPIPQDVGIRVAPAGVKSVLALNEDGVLTNVALGAGQSLPEGFRKYERPSNLATSDPLKFYQAVKKDQIVKDLLDITPQYSRMRSAIEESKKGGSLVAVDQTLINTFNRILDPQSVVRESEYIRTASDQSVYDYLKGKFDPKTGKLILGGAGLTPETRDAMIAMANRFYNSSLQNYNHAAREYRVLAESKGLDPDQVIPKAVDIEVLGRALPTTQSNVPSFATVQEMEAAGLPSGTKVIVGGKSGTYVPR